MNQIDQKHKEREEETSSFSSRAVNHLLLHAVEVYVITMNMMISGLVLVSVPVQVNTVY